VIYRSKMHATRKQNLEVFSASDWLAALTAHIPSAGEQLVRYYCWYSNVSRGKRRKAQGEAATANREIQRDIPFRGEARVGAALG
jgi:hypothetical protein